MKTKGGDTMINIAGLMQAGALALALATPAAAQVQWSLGTSSTGSEPYVSGTVLANVINEHQDVIDLSAQG